MGRVAGLFGWAATGQERPFEFGSIRAILARSSEVAASYVQLYGYGYSLRWSALVSSDCNG